jgi:hypothetical protein
VAVVLLLSCVVMAAAEPQPQVLQPDAAVYTTTQRSTLSLATEELGRVLGDRALGAQRALGERGWTSLEFAKFTAGSLEGLGYQVAIVSAPWADGQHGWVLVGVDVGGLTAWIPVEAAPAPGVAQEGLGRIGWDGAGRYDARYALFEQIVELAPNVAPTAGFRGPTAGAHTGEIVTFLALTSHDSDGEIVLYLWGVDEADRLTATKTMSFDYTFETNAPHTVSLTVVDNRGARATTSLTVQVYGLDTAGSSRPSTGCGCGGG